MLPQDCHRCKSASAAVGLSSLALPVRVLKLPRCFRQVSLTLEIPIYLAIFLV
jgi:hypothetical protein